MLVLRINTMLFTYPIYRGISSVCGKIVCLLRLGSPIAREHIPLQALGVACPTSSSSACLCHQRIAGSWHPFLEPKRATAGEQHRVGEAVGAATLGCEPSTMAKLSIAKGEYPPSKKSVNIATRVEPGDWDLEPTDAFDISH